VKQEDVAALVDEIEAAWNSHDMGRFAACFATDADFVNVAGAWWRGREEIEERHAASHAERFKNSTMRLELASFKEVGSDIGVLHVRWQLDGSRPERSETNDRDAPGDLVVDGAQARRQARNRLCPQHRRTDSVAHISSAIRLRTSGPTALDEEVIPALRVEDAGRAVAWYERARSGDPEAVISPNAGAGGEALA